jgi:LmbE family N-acetylglucosaminyl deacetylase
VTTPIFDHRTAGTCAPAWRRRRDMPAAPPLRAGDRLLVVAAHPDDETLGAGGLIAMAARLAVPVTVLVATDGEASHPQSLTHTAAQLAEIRRAEVRAAIARLHAHAGMRFLGLPDGRLHEHVPVLAAAIAELGSACSHLVTPWRGDGHPDHTAAADAAAAAFTQATNPPAALAIPHLGLALGRSRRGRPTLGRAASRRPHGDRSAGQAGRHR